MIEFTIEDILFLAILFGLGILIGGLFTMFYITEMYSDCFISLNNTLVIR